MVTLVVRCLQLFMGYQISGCKLLHEVSLPMQHTPSTLACAYQYTQHSESMNRENQYFLETVR